MTDDRVLAAPTATLETSDVLLYVACLVVFVIVLDAFLHSLEHTFKRHRKYAEMLHKTTQELMIVGLIYLMVKFCLYVGLVAKGGIAYQAMDAADILVFFLAIALVLQAIVIFMRLRRSNKKMDKISIISARDLVAEAEAKQSAYASHWNKLMRTVVSNRYEERMHMKILGHFFLKTYELPKIFSFPKYIREVQDSQIAHLIEIDVTVWLVLFGIYAAFFACTGELVTHSAYQASKEARMSVFAGFGLSLSLAMLLLLVYLRYLVQLLMGHAFATNMRSSITVDEALDMREFVNLKRAMEPVIREEEREQTQTIQDALDQMQRVEEELTSPEMIHAQHHGAAWLAHDLLLQVLRSAMRRLRGLKPNIKKNTLSAKLTATGGGNFTLPYFSHKLVHFFMQLFLIINGFYLALLLNCVMYMGGSSISNAFRIVGLALPLLFNAVVLAPKIVRQFSLVSGTWRVEPKKLARVIEHVFEVNSLTDQMVKQIVHHLHRTGQHIRDVENALARADAVDDDAGDGFIHTEVLRDTLKQFGFAFSRHKFHTFVRLRFATKGKTIRYQDLMKLLPPTMQRSRLFTPTALKTATPTRVPV
ncbi:hypothetical protein SPRG_14445 [Saprolegnia parasitica CBS 223.65]|uniref:EF-hand domain-containing protein n=1 Tax=Saprolegnia parasitica (strain CBS 223.65) TaxID=695850 RepID=A0A067BU01_SAPPC|nr:hypothetical protein SPRG_14445 [Saprolegnia parasitica CBS 223.65]KDO20310.1 hypothetical protein SPRG_14445 [Saprolegnia parasitica CBS 223.65]|eukprot:XP_012208979.1 hypothetical protein SPRG_14445 [Saprolegnia parasitica CBS 223.65]